MTGFIKKLFRSQPPEPVVEPSKPVAPPQAGSQAGPQAGPQSGGAYFLDADAAKTFGNLDYMRSSRSIRKTFPKKAVGTDNASVRTVSALQSDRSDSANSTSQVDQAPTGSQSERRKADASMDLFRNMARDIKKG